MLEGTCERQRGELSDGGDSDDRWCATRSSFATGNDGRKIKPNLVQGCNASAGE